MMIITGSASKGGHYSPGVAVLHHGALAEIQAMAEMPEEG